MPQGGYPQPTWVLPCYHALTATVSLPFPRALQMWVLLRFVGSMKSTMLQAMLRA